ncbi:MAG: LPS export ABC transporter periplasmic protein LptC, partial [Pseudomonadota bacterium]
MPAWLDARRALLALVLVSAAVLSWWVSRSLAPAPGETVVRHAPDYVMNGFRVVSHDTRGRIQHVLQADQLRHYPDDGSYELDRPYLIRYGEGAPTHVRARHAWMPAERNVTVAIGHGKKAA